MQRGRLHVIENAHTSFSQVRGCIAGNVWIKPSSALIINPAPAYPVIPTGQSYYRRGPGPSFSRNISISSSLIGVGLIALAIHMLRTASETPISAAIRGMLWS